MQAASSQPSEDSPDSEGTPERKNGRRSIGNQESLEAFVPFLHDPEYTTELSTLREEESRERFFDAVEKALLYFCIFVLILVIIFMPVSLTRVVGIGDGSTTRDWSTTLASLSRINAEVRTSSDANQSDVVADNETSSITAATKHD